MSAAASDPGIMPDIAGRLKLALGFYGFEEPGTLEPLAENTYMLTLDGDIDFQLPAVTLLVDLMKLAAAP